MKNKPGFWGGIVCGLLIALIVLAAILFGESVHNFILGRGFTAAASSILTSPVKEKISLLNDYIDYYYLDYQEDDDSGETDEDRAEGMYKGLVDSLNDKYSSYYTAKEYSRLSESTEGSFEGIGVTIIQNDDGYFEVSGFASEDSSAKKAGVEVGDIFYKVDDEYVNGMDMVDLVDHVRGKKGTSVRIVMLRGEAMEEVEFLIDRQKVEAVTVSSNMVDDETGYIVIGAFEGTTVRQFEKALEDLKKQGMKRLVLDLRGNGGGMVDAAVKVADDIIPTGVVTYTLDSKGNRKDYMAVTPEELGMPLAILVDSSSASASELLTGAIKDYGKGTVVGTTTFGKGIVQNIYPLADGSAIKLTNSRYYTPNGLNIQGTGIEPDVKVEFDLDAYDKDGTDSQLDKAVEIVKSK
ncbi:MAG: S41 family peptidase [Lachnospiraceae bacterium]|nr:S41 family peptidase [Lachnospiraceae bacterium]